jgi:hypothetical protein
MSTHTSIINGRPPRKQLSEQLDRLDSIIDGLCEGLPRAVADAAREGTRAAVKDAILEVLTNPELRALIRNIAPAPAAAGIPVPTVVPERPSLWSRIKARVAAVRSEAAKRYRSFRSSVTTTTRTVSALMPLRRILVVALGVGAVVTVIGFEAPTAVSAVIAGICGGITAAAAQVCNVLRRSLHGFSPRT